jgi:hypothetical protein
VSLTVTDQEDSYTIINTQGCASQQGASFVSSAVGILWQRPKSGTFSLTNVSGFPNNWRYSSNDVFIEVSLSDEVSLYANGEPNASIGCAAYSTIEIWFNRNRTALRPYGDNQSVIQPVTFSELSGLQGTFDNRLFFTKYCKKYVLQSDATCQSRDNHTIVSRFIANRFRPLPDTPGGGTVSVEGYSFVSWPSLFGGFYGAELPQQYQNFPISCSVPYGGWFASNDPNSYDINYDQSFACANNGTTLHSKSRSGPQSTTQATMVINSVTATLPDGSTQGIFDI